MATWSALQLRNLVFVGPQNKTSSLEFASGVNVICGASDTGKSFIVEAIDFLLGGSGPLRDIPERIGYDRAFIGISTRKNDEFSFQRSVEGGEFKMYPGLYTEISKDENGTKLGSKHAHGREDNLSGWLLSQTGLFSKRIRKNARGETQSLSFRDLARLVLVQEEEIIKRSSPFLTGQYVTKTSEYSALKLLLTGVDDSALVAEADQTRSMANSAAKIELVEQWLADLNSEISDIGTTRDEVEGQLVRLEQAISMERVGLERIQAQVDNAVARRRELFESREQIKNRIAEIQELFERFDLLSRHYQVDIERLEAIQESGSLFVHQEVSACPLCGAAPEHQHLSDCGGDVEPIVQAAGAEISKIHTLQRELGQTVTDLQSETKGLRGELEEIEANYRKVDDEVRATISPQLGAAHTTYGELVDKRAAVKNLRNLFERIDRLEAQKLALVKEVGGDEDAEKSRTDLSKTVLGELSKTIERLLQAWHFPGAEQVYFDSESNDFVIDGKLRTSRGKGLRAITHAAVSIGLMEYCRDKSLPHPGFVVLDSPLLAYWGPEGKEDNLSGTDLKDKFYEYLIQSHRDSQIIIIENEHPSEKIARDISLTVFTKNPTLGRYGLFSLNN